jgi:hypothetical protein
VVSLSHPGYVSTENLCQDQAFGRAHRIGQKKPVNIWKLTIEGTVEERILGVRVLIFSSE